jgi:hypothetical protein
MNAAMPRTLRVVLSRPSSQFTKVSDAIESDPLRMPPDEKRSGQVRHSIAESGLIPGRFS